MRPGSMADGTGAAMTEAEVIDVFRASGAILEGHFILSSGLRSPVFIQKARVFMYPDRTEQLCRALAARLREAGLGRIDLVVSPAVGGIVPGYETARQLGIPAVWVEREDGQFRLRRFEMPPAARVVIVEDIVTTGLSIRETMADGEGAWRRGGRLCLPHRPLGRRGRSWGALGRAGALQGTGL